MKTKHPLFPYIALGLLLFLLYSNTFSSPFIFDDSPNIVNNAPLRIDNLMPDTLWHTFFAYPMQEGKLYRPVSCLSLALNWYIGQDNTIGYHIVNLLIHYCTAVILFLTILELFESPALASKYNGESKYFIALLTALLWAINPVQTEAVTYIVQRMASLTTLFYILAVYWYLKGRLASAFSPRPFLYCLLSSFFALGSKENSVFLPAGLLLIEYTFFFPVTRQTKTVFLKILSALTLIIFILGIVYFFNSGIAANFFNLAGSRPYTYSQRLLTESRVVFFYLSLLFYPIPARLSIDHDIVLSTSLFSPWTTSVSIAAILLLVILSFQQIRKHPLISFAILFFLLNQIVESTVLPLELIFEHRNYLPSLFLFLPVAAGLSSLLNRYGKLNRIVYWCIAIFTTLLIVSIGTGTYIRNMAYASSETIWADSMLKAPLSSRPYSILGIMAGWQKDHSPQAMEKGLAFHYLALNRYLHARSFKPAILDNMGGIYFNYGYYDKAIEYFKKSLAVNPHFVNGLFHLSQAYFKKGQFSMALNQINKLIESTSPQSRFYNVQGLALLWEGKPVSALRAYQNAMYLLKDKKTAYYGLGTALSRSGYYHQARWFLLQARNQEKQSLRIALTLLENSIRAQNPALVKKDALYIFEKFDIKTISEVLKILPTEYSSAPVDVKLIKPIIVETAKGLSESLFKK